MENQILIELTAIKVCLTKLVGSPTEPSSGGFSNDLLDKAAKEFQTLSIQRGEWLRESEIDKVIKKAPYRAGIFLRETLGFTNFFKKGHDYYYNKEDLLSLAKELKERDVDLKRYMELKDDQLRFEKARSTTTQKKSTKSKPFKLPKDAKNIPASPPVLPPVDAVRKELKALKSTFFQNNYGEYIDIYKGSYSMLKHIYFLEKYMEPGLKRQINKWCQAFNEANQLIFDITKKKEVFIPIKEEDMIQL